MGEVYFYDDKIKVCNKERKNVMEKNLKKSKDEEWSLNVGCKETQLSLVIMQSEKFHEKKEEFPHYKELCHSLGSVRGALMPEVPD